MVCEVVAVIAQLIKAIAVAVQAVMAVCLA